MHSALDRSPPILAEILFSADFINIFVSLVASQFTAGVGEGAEENGQGGAVAYNRWCSADYAKLMLVDVEGEFVGGRRTA